MASSTKSTLPDLTPDASRISVQEPIAIIGLGCRLPGGVSSLNEFWDMLVNEKTGQCDIPSSRLNIDAFYHPDKDRPGSVNMKGGYFLQEDIRTFENSFFGINNLEATYMDPQQRKLLEVVYESFESAGTRLEDVSGSNTGVYVGNFTMDFQVMQTKDPEYLHRYSATGMGTTILSNRVSHVFNLQGPSMVLDTACSSSLYCLHTAVMALRNHECDAAIAAGVNLIQSPEQHIGTMKAGVLSKTSICHSFSSLADGYGRADGVGAVYVKRLSDAIANRDPIRAVIRGSAVNANGRTPGITQPSSAGQEAVIRKAHLQAGLDLKDTCYIEAHGTGTPVGDPIEVRALANAFLSSPRSSPLMIGSVKPNLGHSEAASGISSLIKVVLALERGIIPPTANVGSVNPEINVYDSNVEIVTRNTPWPCDGLILPRQAGINSFGYGGANAHLVLESSDTFVPTGYHSSTISCNILKMVEKRFLLHFSASSLSSLTEQVSKLRGHAVNLVDLAYTLENRRSRLSTHGFVIARQRTILDDLQPHNLILSSTSKVDSQRGLTFVFTGQGAQWAQMGKGLIDQYPSFRSSILKYDAILKSLNYAPSWSLIDTLTLPIESSKINQASRAQPACTAIQIALVDLLSTWEIRPSAVIGHSSGEIAAAYASGFLTSKEALTIAYYRGYVVGNLQIKGQMMAISLGQEESQAVIERNGLVGQAVVACVNSPNNVTLSGNADAIDILYSIMSRPDIFRRMLLTDNRAYHSHHMTQVGDEYESLIRSSCTPLKQRVSDKSHVEWVSSVSLEWQANLIDYSYWRRNLEQPVLFEPALRKLMDTRPAPFLEIGPHGAMELPIRQTQESMGVTTQYFQSLTRGESSDVSLLKLISHLCLSGAPIPLNIVNGLENIAGAKDLAMIGKVSKNLPPYPWRYDAVLWHEPRASIEFRNRKYPRHELLGSIVPGGNLTDFTWRNVLNPKDVPWIQDHRLDSTIVFPAAGYIAMAMEAVIQALGKRQPDSLCYEISNVNILTALTLSSQERMVSAELLTSLRRQKATATSKSNKWWDFEILSLKDGKPSTHATGSITVYTSNEPVVHATQPEPGSSEFSAVRSWYRKMKEEGLNFGKRFQTMKTLRIPRNKIDRWAIAEVGVLQRTTAAVEEDSTYIMHPTTIDSILQTAIIAGAHGVIPDLIAQIPVAIGSAVIYTPSAVDLHSTYTVFANSQATSVSTSIVSTELRKLNEKLYVAIRGMRLTTYTSSSRNETDINRHPMLRVCWKPDLVNLQTARKELEIFINGEAAAEIASSDVSTRGKLFHMSALTQLICHKNPQARILYLLRDWSDQHDLVSVGIFMANLGSGTHLPSFGSFFVGKVTSKGILHRKCLDDVRSITEITSLPSEKSSPDLDIIIVPEVLSNSKDLAYLLQLQNPNGVLLSLQSGAQSFSFRQGKVDELSSWDTTSICGLDVTLKRTQTIMKGTLIKKFVVVENQNSNALGVSIKANLSHLAESIVSIPFDAVSATSIPPNCTVVVAIETLMPLLSTMDEGQMLKLKTLTDHATNIVWLTSSGTLNVRKPDMALVNGLSRSLMLEQPSLSFFTLDVESQTPPEVTVKHIAFILSQNASSSIVDYEFVERNSILHISRFLPDNESNGRFRRRLGKAAVEMTLAEARNCILDQSSISLGQKPRFKRTVGHNQVADEFVEIQVMAVGISERDNRAVLGKAETRKSTCAMEFTGIVKAVGASVLDLAPGERVAVMAPTHFCLVEQVPAWACQRLEASESFTTLSTMFEVYAIAQYALHDLGHVVSGEYVLIHIDPSGIGLAAIRIAQLAEAKVICTVFTSETRDYLIELFDFDSSHVLVLDTFSYLTNIMAATNGRGVDIVLNVHNGDLLRDSWKACADFGRFVDISSGSSDTLDIRLSSGQQLTYTAFHLETLFYSENRQMQHKWSSLMHGMLKLYRSGLIRPLEPIKILDVSELSEAFRSASGENTLSKVVVSLESRSTIINVLPPKYTTVFSPEKTYFLVGCLGGLGSALAKWMASRGAQKFIFLGRSGTDRPSARNLVEDLKSSGAKVSVVRGDVESMDDVQRAVDSIEGTLGGVIQAAMGLSEALFTTMSHRAWHAGIGPKLRGTWNIHNAIKSREEAGGFDFFLMTSSVSGSVGTATESNYCAANHFLDAFARYRNLCNKPAISLGLGMISEIGYLHENQEIEEMLLRKGVQPIDEEELLQIVDISLSSSNSRIPSSLRSDPLARSHLLTGLEPLALKKLRESGFDVHNPILSDPRASLLAKTVDGLATVSEDGNTDAILSKELNQAIKSAGEDVILRDIIATLVIKQFCNLILVAVEKLDSHQPLSTYGLDSMLAADFRSWLYRVFKADVPFLDLLSSSLSLNSLIDRIENQVLGLSVLPAREE